MIIEDSFDVNIFSALSAQDAMPLVLNNDIDLILSDIQMPEIDGFEFADYLKGMDKTKDIPIIFITGIYDKDEYQEKGYSLGAVDYITKPIDDKLLTSKLKVYIELFESKKSIKEELNDKNELLIHQSKMATMGEMIGVISHQLKQPLNIMSLYCNDVKDSYIHNELDEAFIDKFHKDTNEQIKFMNNTINGFVDFFNPSKVKSSFSLKNVFDNTISLLSKQMENNNISIHSNIENEIIYGVENELAQVLLNLITNSKDAFIKQEISDRHIFIKVLVKDKQTILSFQDNAGGIEEKYIDKIFDPYFTTKKEGTGTGLYMVKLVIQNSFAGKINIQNTDKGLKFIIELNNQKD